jgi:hypothetical protein
VSAGCRKWTRHERNMGFRLPRRVINSAYAVVQGVVFGRRRSRHSSCRPPTIVAAYRRAARLASESNGRIDNTHLPMRFLQEVKLPEKCLLNEVLLWVAFRRIPIAMISPEEGKEVRDAEEDMFTYGGYTGDLPDSGAYLEDCECASVGLPPDPRRSCTWGAA